MIISMKRYFLLIQLFLFMGLASGQQPNHELIIRWKGEKRTQIAGATFRTIVPALNIDVLSFNDEVARERALKALQREALVEAVERNQEVDFRIEPNDTRYAEEQGNLTRVGFDRAWDLTPGGRTVDGEEIVVAVLDAGFDVLHNDLKDNLWINTADAPGDGIDNDNNGYIDDKHGWDFISGRPVFPRDNHGTRVIGILGAKGNNGFGITGTNWDIKMMLFSILSVADIIEAYGYILAQRQLYNETNGAQGALVVATNASFGIEGSTCTDYPVWGRMYDDLGAAGILTAASTANRSWDVDNFGDMPTDCASDYLIGVANLGTTDRLHTSSGYGRESVDLAAPGEGSFSTSPNNSYSGFASTSAAAPFVTGAIALLYATPCEFLMNTMRSDPAAAALLIRDAVLSSVTPNATVEFRTSSGGVLDVAEAQRLLAEQCNADTEEAFEITSIFPNPASANATIVTNAIVFSEGATVELYDALGRLVSKQQPPRVAFAPVTLSLDLTGLPAGWYTLRLEERDRVAVSRIVVR